MPVTGIQQMPLMRPQPECSRCLAMNSSYCILQVVNSAWPRALFIIETLAR